MAPILFDLHQGGRYSESFGRYCQSLLETRFDEHRKVAKPKLSLDLRSEAHQIVNMAYYAFTNRGAMIFPGSYLPHAYSRATAQLNWSFKDLSKALDALGPGQPTPEQRHDLLKTFEPLGTPLSTGRLPCLTEPSCFVDSEGVIGFWSFPSVIQRKRQDFMLNAVHALSDGNGLTRMPNDPNRYFDVDGNALRGGTAKLELCNLPDGARRPALCPIFLGPDSAMYIKFLEEMQESFAVLGGILAVTHPWLFDAGLSILSSLEHGKIDISQPENLLDVLSFWSSPFSKFELVTNRETILQRIVTSPTWAYDLVWTGGTLTLGRFECPTLGYRFHNTPGTVFVGHLKLIEHGIALGKSEQVQIFASFHESILKRVPQYYIPKAPTLEMWTGYWLHK
ncbi:hypothetical protein CC1G_14762 [Coprinopsis cinerea okayama7|uniref:2OGFeDO JBP1/TET oxygenase domain-containing protein n=1 Tax=Coprinopsis cinerea (strain Okayama-7 / 130 / ATCC MYA-4618 / FGSC 9003) TaxID=240176 RepID=D6RNM5_COPC7|nr:hypothetical protein CC1G_14762 [Coprinopsis cinerea okayama7\|eukprot:XP_002910784.1 hypothetical protein CC1G_14762 [Coprinopsis cinerea okayama7\